MRQEIHHLQGKQPSPLSGLYISTYINGLKNETANFRGKSCLLKTWTGKENAGNIGHKSKAMILEKELLFEGALGEQRLTALFDTGSTYSCIHPDCVRSLDKPIPVRHPFKVELDQKGQAVEIRHAIRLDFYIDGYHFSDEFVIVPDLSEKVIIGAATMQKWRFKLDFEKEELIIDPRVTRLRLG